MRLIRVIIDGVRQEINHHTKGVRVKNDLTSSETVFSKSVLRLILWGWLIVFFIGLYLTHWVSQQQFQQIEQQWQQQLQLTVQSQKHQFNQWLNSEKKAIEALANNSSLQLYATEVSHAPASPVNSAYLQFITNLLTVQAEQHGYYERRITDAVRANIHTELGASLSLMDTNLSPIVSIGIAPRLGSFSRDVRAAIEEKQPIIGPFRDTKGRRFMMFIHPVTGVQQNAEDAPLGYMLGMKPVDAPLAEILALPPQASQSATSSLIRKGAQGDGTLIEYLIAPQAEHEDYFTMDGGKGQLAAAYALAHAGEYFHGLDYRGTPVIAASAELLDGALMLYHKVNETEAFATITQRQQMLLGGYCLFSALLTAGFIALWRNAGARRAQKTAHYFQAISMAEQKQKSLLKHLVKTLIMLVDSRDPHAKHHSDRVSLVAESIALQMQLDEKEIETCALAASLMNVGKIKTSEKMLQQKEDKETAREKIRQSILDSANLLSDISFEGPVVETLRQTLEHVDGSGPLKLSDDDILMSAKIVSVANAFIALTSERAYRKAVSLDKAVDTLYHSADTLYARPVIAALQHYIENGGGREALGQT